MIQNYFKIALRKMLRNKGFSFINIFGLTLGTICCLYILIYVQDHRSYDKHHDHAGDLYRVISDLRLATDRDVMEMSTCSPPIPPALQEDFPEVSFATRVCRPPGVEQFLLRRDEKVVYEKEGYFVDSTFFDVFTYHFVQGNPDDALDQPYSVVISQELADKLFSNRSALGETIHISDYGEERAYQIKGIYNGSLGNTHLMPSFFMTMNSGSIGQYIRTSNSWAGNNFIHGYVRLEPGTNPQSVEAKFESFLLKHGENQLRDLGMEKSLSLQPVKEIHTTAGLTADMPGNTSSAFLSLLLLIAGFIQLVACINFMNLTTARSMHRAREVGVRKTVGAPKHALILQFIGESFLMVVLAVGIALPLLQLSMPFLNQLTGTPQQLQFNWSFQHLGIVLLLLVLTGILSGSYPALYLSSFKPIKVLKGSLATSSGKGESGMRKLLVVSQFVIAITLVISALVVHEQLQYMLKKDLGFEKNQKIVFGFQLQSENANPETFRREILTLPQVVNASAMSEAPGQSLVRDISMYKRGGNMNTAVHIRLAYADDQFLQTLKINLLAGRNFRLTDTSSTDRDLRVIINETTTRELGIPVQEAPGTVLYSEFEGNHFEATIVGVMEDILYQNLTGEMGAFMVVAESARRLRILVVDINTVDYQNFIAQAEAIWNNIMPGTPFDFSFLDADIARLYEGERTLSRIIGAFTLMAILISCLGLFGLSAFAAERRTKEIGIRKILGANTRGIILLLSREYIWLIAIAFIIAAPGAYLVLEHWLSDFAYRINTYWWVFVAAAISTIAIAALTISYQSIKVATNNPVNSLRTE